MSGAATCSDIGKFRHLHVLGVLWIHMLSGMFRCRKLGQASLLICSTLVSCAASFSLPKVPRSLILL
jgi:hypothetical protein